MNTDISKVVLLLSLMTIIAGCAIPGASQPSAVPRSHLDNYSLTQSTLYSDTGCAFDYRVYEPHKSISQSSVILGHGFLRDQDNLISLSRELANHGIRVVTLDFCNMRLWNGNHLQNAQDMRKIARELDRNSIIYGGFSAGALAAILAADEATIAILTLDLVDQDKLGANAIGKLNTPLINLFGPASACNAYNDAQSLFSVREAAAAKAGLTHSWMINNASHCEFESPSNWLCELACGDRGVLNTRSDDQLTRRKVIRRVISAIKPLLDTQSGS